MGRADRLRRWPRKLAARGGARALPSWRAARVEPLEDRRLLSVGDAAILFLPPAGGPGEPALTAVLAAGNAELATVTIEVPPGEHLEGAAVTLTSTVSGADPQTLDYAWTVRRGSEIFATGSGADFTFTPDDNATYDVALEVTLDGQPWASDGDAVVVNNAAPVLGGVQMTPQVDENGTATLSGTLADAGAHDSLTLVVDWGDGTQQTYTYAAGTTSFSETHQYLDDDPSGTSVDEVEVQLTLLDKDDGNHSTSAAVVVRNLAPEVAITGAPADALQGTPIALGSLVSDVGTLDTIVGYAWVVSLDGEVVVTGEGATLTFTPADSGNYTVALTATDDDGGEGVGSVAIVVQSVPPSLSASVTPQVDENGTATLTGEVVGAGAGDAFTVVIDWGEGAPETFSLPAGTTTFSKTHQYLDDNPTATTSDPYTVQVTLTGDGVNDSRQLTTTVANVAPTVSIVNAPTESQEGTEIALEASVTDPGTLDTFSFAWTVTKNGAPFAEGSGPTLRFTPDDDGNYQVSINVTDDDSGVGTAATTIAVSNVAPRIEHLSAATAVDENQREVTLLGDIVDPGLADTFTVRVDWGDGQVETLTYQAGAAFFSASHMYLDDDPTGTPWDAYTIEAMLTDDEGEFDTADRLIRVNNVAPYVTIEGAPARARVGESFTLSSLVVDPGVLDTHTYQWVVELDGAPVGGGSDVGLVFTPASEGVYTFTLTATDDDTGAGSDTVSVFIDPPGPSLDSLTADPSVSEGETLGLSGTIVDSSGASSYTVTVDWGTGAGPEDYEFPAGTASFALSHRYADNGPTETLNLSVRVNGGSVHQLTTQVLNALPSVTPAVQSVPVSVGMSFSGVLAQFSDAGQSDTHTATIDWGDGTIEAGVIVENAGNGVVTGSHTYAADGHYTARITVVDNDGGTTTSTFQMHAAEVLSPVDYRLLDDVSWRLGGRLFLVETTRAGFFTVEALFAGSSSELSMQLYDASFNLLAYSGVVDGRPRVEWESPAPTTYFVSVTGSVPQYDLKLVNLVSRSGSAITVEGSAEADHYVYAPGAWHFLTVNGVPYQFSPLYTEIGIRGGDGDDSADITATAAADVVTFRPGSAQLTGGISIDVQQSETITVRGGSSDTAYFFGSTGADTFSASATEATMTDGALYTNRATGIPSVTAVASGNDDTAELTGTAQEDKFTGNPDYGKLENGSGLFLKALRFKRITVDGGGGADVARFEDTPAHDEFTAGPRTATFSGGGLHYTVDAFADIRAFSEKGGDDTAVFQDDAAGDDIYEGSPTDGKLYNADYLDNPVYRVIATTFASVEVRSSGGADVALLYGSAGDETFTAESTRASLAGDGFAHAVADFPEAHAVGKGGTNDEAFYLGTADLEAFAGTFVYGRWAGVTEGGQSYLYRAVRFDHVTATTDSSDDVARFYGSEYGDVFEAEPLQGRMYNLRSDNRAVGFTWIHAYANELAPTAAYLTDSEGDDTLVAKPTEVRLYNVAPGQAAFFIRAANFDEVYATAGRGGDDQATADDSALADVLTVEDDWASLAAADLAYSQRFAGFDRLVARSKTSGDGDTVQATPGYVIDLVLELYWEN